MGPVQPVLAQAPTPIVFCEVDGHPVGDELLQTLRIQARGSEVRKGAPLAGHQLPQLVASARERCAMWPSGTIVWLANADGPLMLSVLDCKSGRVLSEMTDPPAHQDPAEQRALALKITSLVQAVRAQDPSATAPASAVAADPAPEPAPTGTSVELAAVVHVSRVPSIQGAAVGRLALLGGLGARADFGTHAAALNAVVRLLPGESETLAGQRLDTAGVAPGLALSGMLPRGGLSPSLELTFFLNRTTADGITAQGSRGELSAWIPQLELTAGVGYDVVDGLALEARAGGVCNLLRRRLEVDGVQLGDTGTCGVVMSFGLRH